MSDNTKSEDRLLHLAGSVAESHPIDWNAEIRAHSGIERKLHHLRVIESIANVHRAAGAAVDRDEVSHADPDAPPPPARWGPLQILEPLGRGSSSEVFRAHDARLGQDVALKLLHASPADTQAEERFLHEARQLARVRHPNVVIVHGVDRHDGRIGLWTELLAGRTLDDDLQLRGRLSAEEAAVIGIDLCQALAAVHGAGLVHRDVKTANVMRSEGGRIVLLDFSSVASRMSNNDGEPVSGTPLFMAPEVLNGERASVASDLYSLGVLLYRLVTEHYPVEARTLGRLREAHGHGPVPLRDRRPDLAPGFIRVVEKATDPDPARRHGSAGEMERELCALTCGQSQSSPEDSRKAWPAVLAAAIVLLAALGAGWIWRPAAAFHAEAQILRVTDTRTEPMTQGARLSVGDGVALHLHASRRFWAYVVTYDENGEAFLLFPLRDHSTTNPLAAGVEHNLPGGRAWEVNSAGGLETIVAVASYRPIPDLEEQISILPEASSDPAPLSRSWAGKLRGIGGLKDLPPDPIGNQGALARLRQQKRAGTFVWEWVLNNPAPPPDGTPD